MLVKEVMNTDVKTVSFNTSIKAAATTMKKFTIGSLVVVKNSKLFGILTRRDIVEKLVAEGLDSAKTKVIEVMSKEVIMISPDKDINEAAEIMIEKKVKKLPVIKGNRLVGIVTAFDLCAAEPKLIDMVGSLMLLPKDKKTLAG